MIRPPIPLHVRVPASTSNLGPGFDVLGLALDRTLDVAWEPEDGPLRFEAEGTVEGLSAADDLVARTLAEALGAGLTDLGGRLRIRSAIPVARGLGSSAAARTAGALLAWSWRHGIGTAPGSPVALGPAERDALLAAVAAAEGHPDNAVPAAVGGFVAASLDGGMVRWTPLPLSPGVGMAFAAPATEVRTDEARRVLPATLSHADAVANGARLAILLAGLARADGDRIAWGLEDRLHVPWRWPLVPGADAAAAAAVEAGAWGVTLSGSGSGLLAFGPPGRAEAMAAAMDGAFATLPGPGHRSAFPVRPTPVGAAVVRD